MDWIKRPNPATSTRKRIQFPGIKFPYHHSKRLTHFYTIHMECVCDTYCLKPQELCYREETFRYLAVLRGKCTWHSLRRKAPAKRETSFFFSSLLIFLFLNNCEEPFELWLSWKTASRRCTSTAENASTFTSISITLHAHPATKRLSWHLIQRRAWNAAATTTGARRLSTANNERLTSKDVVFFPQ